MLDYRKYYPDAEQTAAIAAELDKMPLPALLERARGRRPAGRRPIISFSPKVFIPLTRLCRDVCAYCTFAKVPREVEQAYLSPENVLDIARAGAAAGCSEALFTLGERPEQRYQVARQALAALGCSSTIEYLGRMAALVQKETGLLAHVNPGVLDPAELALLRTASVSQGLMLESAAERLCDKGGPHHGSPGKHPRERIATLVEAGRQRIPFTTGLLVGIGESRIERIESLLVIRNIDREFGHIQEVIVQNFRPKNGTRMEAATEPGFDELLWSTAAARIILDEDVRIQVPPNLSFDRFPELLDAGIDDWGGVSPVTPDHVNPEAPWPALDRLRRATEEHGFDLVARLPLYPEFARGMTDWIDPSLATLVRHATDASGWARRDRWSPGIAGAKMTVGRSAPRRTAAIDAILTRAARGALDDPESVERLFAAHGAEASAVLQAADDIRAQVCGDTVSYTVNRNINYTNICEYRCSFCAFSKGKTSEALRGKPYNLSLEEVARRAREAWERGATEVCMQGGIHPTFTGATYLELLKAVKDAVPGMHVHAFSPLEVTHGAQSLGVSVETFLAMLRDVGLGSLPGTAAEILDDEVRAVLCPDKLDTWQWLHVAEAAHRVGLRTTATIMFGHMESPSHWARHLLHIRKLQDRTGGFTEFVPLPFVHMEAPLFYRGQARKGPTSRETLLMHAVARLVLHPLISNIQTSWVKLGADGASACLAAGANDLGGTLMNESISRAAGTEHGQELPPEAMERLIVAMGRTPFQRTTLYRPSPEEQRFKSYGAAALQPLVMGIAPVAGRFENA